MTNETRKPTSIDLSRESSPVLSWTLLALQLRQASRTRRVQERLPIGSTRSDSNSVSGVSSLLTPEKFQPGSRTTHSLLTMPTAVESLETERTLSSLCSDPRLA